MKEADTRKKDLKTLGTLAAFLLAVSLLFHKAFFALLAFGLFLVGLLFRGAAAKMSALWLRFSGVLGAFNTRLILGLVYYLFLTPVAFFARLFNKDPLTRARTTSGTSYFRVRDHVYAAEDLEKMW